MSKRNFITVEQGTTYKLPKYRVIDGVGIEMIVNELKQHDFLNNDWKPMEYQEITFVRGDKTDNGKVIERVDGILHEQLLATLLTNNK